MNAAGLLTYAEAGARIGRSAKYISRRVAKREIAVVNLGYNTKRISELAMLHFIERKTVPVRSRK
jgi:hypothetical protein